MSVHIDIAVIEFGVVLRSGHILSDDYDAAIQELSEARTALKQGQWLQAIPSPSNPPIPDKYRYEL